MDSVRFNTCKCADHLSFIKIQSDTVQCSEFKSVPFDKGSKQCHSACSIGSFSGLHNIFVSWNFEMKGQRRRVGFLYIQLHTNHVWQVFVDDLFDLFLQFPNVACHLSFNKTYITNFAPPDYWCFYYHTSLQTIAYTSISFYLLPNYLL